MTWTDNHIRILRRLCVGWNTVADLGECAGVGKGEAGQVLMDMEDNGLAIQILDVEGRPHFHTDSLTAAAWLEGEQRRMEDTIRAFLAGQIRLVPNKEGSEG